MRASIRQFIGECVAALMAAGVLAGIAVPLAHLVADPAPPWAIWAIVWSALGASLLLTTLRSGGSLRRGQPSDRS